MEFEWDERKASANLRKHGISFDLAIAVFADPRRVEGIARRKDDEDRFYTVGRISPSEIAFVVFTWRRHENQKVCRIISARAAGEEERSRYPALS